MKIAIPEFMEMVSPRFDCCEKITLFKIENWKLKEANDYHFASTGLKEKKELFDSQGVKILICHGILKRDMWILENSGIRVINLISGKLADVIDSFIKGKLERHRIIPINCKCRRRRLKNRGR